MDGVYERGYVMYLMAEHSSTCPETNVVTKHEKSRVRILDSKDALTFWTTDEARALSIFKDFKWDDVLATANEIGEEMEKP